VLTWNLTASTKPGNFGLITAKKKGFGVRKQYFNKRKEDGSLRSFRFVCCKEGKRTTDKRSFLVKKPRAEIRTEWPVRIALTANNEKFVIHEFIEGHNHPLQIEETTHMLASHYLKFKHKKLKWQWTLD